MRLKKAGRPPARVRYHLRTRARLRVIHLARNMEKSVRELHIFRRLLMILQK